MAVEVLGLGKLPPYTVNSLVAQGGNPKGGLVGASPGPVGS